MKSETCPECGEKLSTAKRRYLKMSIGLCIRHCPYCLWTERDPDEQNSLTYEQDFDVQE